MDRRTFIGASAAASAGVHLGAKSPLAVRKRQPKIAIVGGGVFGVWTAWHAQLAGADVTLIDAYQPGHSRASSGGETRQIHEDYANPVYVSLSRRSRKLWKKWEKSWNTQFLYQTGRILMGSKGGEESILESHHRAKKNGIPSEIVSSKEQKRRWPQVNMDGVHLVNYMSTVSLLTARRAVATVAEKFADAGGALRIAKVGVGSVADKKLVDVTASDGSKFKADFFVFACGPWLPKFFPDVLGTKLRSVRRDVFFVGTPSGDNRYSHEHLPAWVYRGGPNEPEFNTYYGFPSFEGRGLKVCPFDEANSFDPDSDSRLTNPYQAKRAKDFVAKRFPGMAGQPLLETRVCQVTDSIGGDYVIDRHPDWNNVWLMGGGAGHGFQHGPALGEYMVARVLETDRKPSYDELFRIKSGSLNLFQRD